MDDRLITLQNIDLSINKVISLLIEGRKFVFSQDVNNSDISNL